MIVANGELSLTKKEDKMSQFIKQIELLEPYDAKVSRTVLRGERGSNASDLPDCRAGKDDRVLIDDGTWLGTNVVVVGNVHIGKQCVIGANSVVTKDIPDYCVAAGSPAKVLKRYNFESKEWERFR